MKKLSKKELTEIWDKTVSNERTSIEPMINALRNLGYQCEYCGFMYTVFARNNGKQGGHQFCPACKELRKGESFKEKPLEKIKHLNTIPNEYIKHLKNIKFKKRKLKMINFENVKGFNEVKLFINIRSMGGRIWYINHESCDGRIKFDDYEEEYNLLQEAIRNAVKRTEQYGVKFTTEYSPSESYWSWFRQWDTWRRELMKDEFGLIVKCINNNIDIDNYLPTIDRTYPKMKQAYNSFRLNK